MAVFFNSDLQKESVCISIIYIIKTRIQNFLAHRDGKFRFSNTNFLTDHIEKVNLVMYILLFLNELKGLNIVH